MKCKIWWKRYALLKNNVFDRTNLLKITEGVEFSAALEIRANKNRKKTSMELCH